MIITIDTAKDSLADVRRAIALLQQIVGDNSYPQYASGTPNVTVGAANVIQDPYASSPATAAPSAPASDGFTAMFGDMGGMVQHSTPQSNSVTSAPAQPAAVQIIGLPEARESAPTKRGTYDFETYE